MTATGTRTATPSPTPTITGTSTTTPSPTVTTTPTATDSPTPTPTSTPWYCASDAECDDGNLCTVDVCDLGVCTHNDASRPVAAPVLTLRALTKAGKAVLNLRADLMLALPIVPAVDPSVAGLRLQLLDGTGTVRDALDLPGGLRDHDHLVGWSASRDGHHWHFSDPTGIGRVRSARLVIDDLSGDVRVRLNAVHGTLPLSTGDEPLLLRVRLGGASAQCGAVTFAPGAPPSCKFSRTGSSAVCH